jgi:hypothetical protein
MEPGIVPRHDARRLRGDAMASTRSPALWSGSPRLAHGWILPVPPLRRRLELLARWFPPNRGDRLFPAALRGPGPARSPRWLLTARAVAEIIRLGPVDRTAALANSGFRVGGGETRPPADLSERILGAASRKQEPSRDWRNARNCGQMVIYGRSAAVNEPPGNRCGKWTWLPERYTKEIGRFNARLTLVNR